LVKNCDSKREIVLIFNKGGDDSMDCKPNLIDLLSAQREIIYFLVKKLQIEEQQRLKTEEQASKMMLHMEKTVKQLVNILERK